jgi:hypothetical protein
MARRKKHHAKRKVSRRRHSMSGVKGGIMSAVTVIAGAVAAQALGKFVDKMLPATTAAGTKTLIDGAAPIALGLILPKVIKSDLGKNLGTGMIAVGGLKLAQSALPALAGIGKIDFYANKPVAKIAGYQTPAGNYMAGYSTAGGNYLAGIAAMAEMEKC